MATLRNPLHPLPPIRDTDLRGRRQPRRSIITHAAQDESGGSKPEAKGKGTLYLRDAIPRLNLRGFMAFRCAGTCGLTSRPFILVAHHSSLRTLTMNYSSTSPSRSNQQSLMTDARLVQRVLVQGSSERGKLHFREVDWQGLLRKGLPRVAQAHQWFQGTGNMWTKNQGVPRC